ncbi:MAG: hypothetical protein KatS3mg111_1772 [Pirellulaceae bacterium]|nr:MAG: hypothetical protein KatS3mg111_1772 [Pirellulaceae bacterium]
MGWDDSSIHEPIHRTQMLKGTRTMHNIGATIADAATMGPRYAHRLIRGIPPERFGRLASPGGQVVPSNHPAFVFGHLSLYPSKVLELLKIDSAPIRPPAEFERLFSKDAQCVDDPEGTIYPSMDTIMDTFFRGYESAIAAVRQASDEQLTAPNPVDTPLREICPTLGSMLAFYLTGHVYIHLGQVSAWRRMEGLPAA